MMDVSRVKQSATGTAPAMLPDQPLPPVYPDGPGPDMPFPNLPMTPELDSPTQPGFVDGGMTPGPPGSVWGGLSSPHPGPGGQ